MGLIGQKVAIPASEILQEDAYEGTVICIDRMTKNGRPMYKVGLPENKNTWRRVSEQWVNEHIIRK